MPTSELRSTHVAVIGADREFYAFLRDACGLGAARGSSGGDGLGYVGREFRTYDFMQVGQAVAFYAALNSGRWAGEKLADDLALARLAPQLEIKRMKRAYQRALVLALAAATTPELLVIEAAEEFDETPTAELLARCAARAARSVVAFGADAGAAITESLRGASGAELTRDAFRAFARDEPSFLQHHSEATPAS